MAGGRYSYLIWKLDYKEAGSYLATFHIHLVLATLPEEELLPCNLSSMIYKTRAG